MFKLPPLACPVGLAREVRELKFVATVLVIISAHCVCFLLFLTRYMRPAGP